MLYKALILALSCACASAALQVAGDDSDCALYLTGPGRSSAYDYSINLLKGNFGYDGQQTCITYDAINQAYLEARQRILVAQPKGDWKPEDYASVGELVLDISINIARRYGLTYEEIEKGLPLIDTSRTLIREVCPPVFSHVECRAGKYRRLDGLCNNLQHPTWGATNAPFQRLLSPLFADGINAPRISHTGRDLPLSRVVSRTMHPDDGFHDHAGTVMVIAWGQFMDHDYTLTGTPLDPINRNDPEECCKRPPHLKHPYCNEIRIPDDDYFYRLFGVKCIDFVRGFPSPRPGCRLGSRTPFNTLTGAIDGNTVYGVSEKFARKLRTGFGGLLRMNPVFKEYGLKDLLPLKLDIPDEGCTRPNKNMYCFEAGEIRVNEQLVLTVMHTLMAREHNRVAQALAEVNPHWDDETLYQESRRINIAEIQHITYNEFLPILLGKDVMEKFGLVLEKEGYWDGYDQEVNPDVLASFASAAYRFGHSLLPTAVERWSKAHKFIASKRLSDLIRRPYDLYRAGVLDEYVMGLMNQVAQAMDDSITQEVTNHLFKKVGARFGMDLVSFNMQRGREFGIPGYMEFRKFCGLPGAETFQELYGSMTNQTVRKYETIFEHPIDVDLWSGGVSERPLPGSMLGPTFACVIATQFSYSRRGDRFWYELPNQPSSFTQEQLVEIRKAKLARVICDNTDIIDTVQLYPMVLPDHELNPRVPCRSGIIPSMDFSKWAEPAPFHGNNAKGFITEAFISRNVTKSNATIEIERNMNVTQDHIQDAKEQNNVNCNCNITNNLNQNELTHCHNNTAEASTDCYNKIIVDEIKKQIDEATDSNDTILKYVYKKNDTNEPEKSKGHYKNSLRRKRSLDSKIDQTAPLIVNYETSHTPGKEREQWLPAKNTAYTIKGSDLADFNIETLHESVDGEKLINNDHQHSKNHDHKNKDSDEIIDRNESVRDNKDSSEELNERKSQEKNDSNERRSHSSNENSQEHVNEHNNSGESDRNDDKNTESQARSRDDDDDKNNYKDSNSKLLKSQSESEESTENSQEDERRYLQNHKNTPDDFDEHKSQFKNHEDNKHDGIDDRSPPKIQDVDLDDFSYERIYLNKNGEIESASDTRENKEFEIIEVNKPQPFSKTLGETIDVPHESSDSSSIEANEPTHINDGEVKPVVEINSETDSIESNEENSSLNVENESLETLTGVKGESNEQNDKLQDEKVVKDLRDVKQEFERIPLNYNHKNENPSQNKDHTPNERSDNTDEEGTVAKIAPKDVKFDENLNIKFDDIAIKLPEIKLPEDILSYAYEDPPVYKYKEEKKKPHFFHYNSDEEKEKRKQSDYDDDDQDSEHDNGSEGQNDADSNGYYGYYGNTKKQKVYKNHKKEAEEDDGDLYEKFVRERFGKRSTFKKRSENLRDYGTHNPQLYERVQNIIEKTKNVKQDAEKSGDPNAGYMWTLEYGEKL